MVPALIGTFFTLWLLLAPWSVAGLDTVWRAPPNRGTGELRVTAVGDAIVLQVQGGNTLVLDGATGGRRRTLIDSAGGEGPIDPYATTSRVLKGALVGPQKVDLSAVELATGKLRWRRTVAGLTSPRDDYALRDTLSAIETPTLLVVAFRHVVSGDAGKWHWEETLAALEPTDGSEHWRQTITRWPDSVPTGFRDALTLAADGDRVIVVKPGQVEAFDAATGTQSWRRPWGSPRALAFAPGRIALAEAGTTVVHVLDASNGQEVVALPALQGSLDSLLFVGANLCATTTSQDQGRAACFALEAGGAREAWHRELSLAFTQVLADGHSLFVTVGGERLLMLDASSGTERWIASFPHWTQLWMATDTKGNGRLFVVDDASTLAAVAPNGRAPARLPGYLRFSLEPAKDGACRLVDAEWVDGDGRRSWTSPLPDRMRQSRGPCEEPELIMYRHSPRHVSIPGMSTLQARGALWVSDHGGLLALDAQTGKTLLDATGESRPLGQHFFFDEGRFTWGSCSGPAPHGRVFAVCGDALLYFNGSAALLVDLATRREKARTSYRSGMFKSGGRAARAQASIPLGRQTLQLDGVIYMR